MAKGHSTSKIRRRRTAPAKKPQETAATARYEPHKHAPKRFVDDAVIYDERVRLLAAEAILSCVSKSVRATAKPIVTGRDSITLSQIASTPHQGGD